MNRRISLDDVQSLQGVDNVIPLRPFCVFPHGNAVSRKSSLSHPFDVSPIVNATKPSESSRPDFWQC